MTDKQTTGQPFDDIRDLIRSMPSVADLSESDVQESAQSLGRGLRPIGSLETPLARISAWQDAAVPRLMRPLIAVFAGTHGVAGKLGFDDVIEASKARVASLTEGQAASKFFAYLVAER